MSRRHYLSLVVVRGDGARVLRLTLSTRLVAALAASLVVTLGAAAGLLMLDWRHVRGAGDAGALREKLVEQRAVIDRMNATVRDLGRQVAGWRDVHARLIEVFGPDHASAVRDRGIGGPAAPVERGSSLPRDEMGLLVASIGEESETVRILDRLLGRAAKILATVPSRWPVHGPVNSEFGNRPSPWSNQLEFHTGLDIRAARGTPVHAPSGGTVTFAGSHPEYGLTVMVDHGHDVKTVYGHLSKVGVGVGQRVEAGASLGLTGNTGRSSGPHLHYEVLVQGQPVNPRAYLWD